MNRISTQILELTRSVASASELLRIKENIKKVHLSPAGSCFFSEANHDCIGLRIIRNGKIGFSSSSDPAMIPELTDMAIASSRSGNPASFHFPESVEPASVKLVHPKLERWNFETLGELVDELRICLLDAFPHSSTSGEFLLSTTDISIANSADLDVSYRKLVLGWNLRFTLPTSNGLFTISSRAITGLPDFQPEILSGEIIRKATWCNRIISNPVIGSRIILSPDAISVILQSVKAGVNGWRKVYGSSPLIGKENTSIASDSITIRDRANLDYGAASAPFDAEGIRTGDKTIIEKGIFKNFIFDLSSAAAAGSLSTGNAGRNCFDLPQPVCTNFVMDTGNQSIDHMISSLSSGIYISDLLSGGNSNVVTGEFSFDTGSVFIVESGEITGRVEHAVITGNVYSMLSDVIEIESSLHLSGTDLVPHILTGNLSVILI